MKETQYWLGVVSAEHVEMAVAQGFAQVCRGKQGPLRRMKAGDWIIYYSPRTEMGGGAPVRSFTALGQIVDERIWAHDAGDGRLPFRRRVRYQAVRSLPLADVMGALHLTQRPHWGMALRRGHLELEKHDFDVIADGMQVASAPGEPPDTFLSWLW